MIMLGGERKTTGGERQRNITAKTRKKEKDNVGESEREIDNAGERLREK